MNSQLTYQELLDLSPNKGFIPQNPSILLNSKSYIIYEHRLNKPTFPEAEINRLQDQLAAAYHSLSDSAIRQAHIELSKAYSTYITKLRGRHLPEREDYQGNTLPPQHIVGYYEHAWATRREPLHRIIQSRNYRSTPITLKNGTVTTLKHTVLKLKSQWPRLEPQQIEDGYNLIQGAIQYRNEQLKEIYYHNLRIEESEDYLEQTLQETQLDYMLKVTDLRLNLATAYKTQGLYTLTPQQIEDYQSLSYRYGIQPEPPLTIKIKERYLQNTRLYQPQVPQTMDYMSYYDKPKLQPDDYITKPTDTFQTMLGSRKSYITLDLMREYTAYLTAQYIWYEQFSDFDEETREGVSFDNTIVFPPNEVLIEDIKPAYLDQSEDSHENYKKYFTLRELEEEKQLARYDSECGPCITKEA